MINNISKITFLAAAISLSSGAIAAEGVAGGTINFTGAITDTTCTINGGKSADFAIDLAPITVVQAGVVNGIIDINKKAFSMKFENCLQGVTVDDKGQAQGGTAMKDVPLLVKFFKNQNVSNDSLYLINNSVNEDDITVAKNVGFSIQDQNAAGTPVDLSKPLTVTLDAEGKGELNLLGSYYKVGVKPAKIGEVNSSVIYTVNYQ